jgi:hypothetical protein
MPAMASRVSQSRREPARDGKSGKVMVMAEKR